MNVEVSNHMQALEADQIKELDKKFKASQSTTIAVAFILNHLCSVFRSI